MTGFQRFVGIDWSGALKSPAIAVASCDADGACELIPPPSQRAWTRHAVLDLLKEEKAGTVAGLDFAFSLPWPVSGPLPSRLDQPNDVVELWQAVEHVCRAEPDFYAGPVYRPFGGWLSDFMFTVLAKQPIWRGPDFRRDRLRQTERILPRAPAAAFTIVGAQTVGPSSFSGMRVLLALKADAGSSIAIWPFEPADPAKLTVVEIYPGFYKGEVDRKPKRLADLERLLAFFGARLSGPAPRDGHELDALVSAAAIRSKASFHNAFATPLVNMQQEGWIFGVPLPDDQT